MPQDTANKIFCKHTKDAQTFLVKPARGMEYIHGKATKMTGYIENAQQKLIIAGGAQCSIVSREYLDNHYQNWEKKIFSTKEKTSKGESGKMTFIGTIIKEIMIPQRRPNRPAFAIGEQTLGKIRGHDIELYLDVERSYPPILRRHLYSESLETRREIEKQINELLDINVIRKIGHNEILEIITPVLITWNNGKSRLYGHFRALNGYTKADRYPIPRIPHVLDKLEKSKYITSMDCMKGFHQNGVKPNYMKLLRIICHMGIYEYTRMSFGIKNAPAHFQRMMDTIFQEEILEGWLVLTFGQKELLEREHKVSGLSLSIDQNKTAAVLKKPVPKNINEIQYFLGFAIYQRNHIKNVAHIAISFYKFYIDAACSKGLRASLHQRQIVDGEPREGVICYISNMLEDSEARYGATHTEFVLIVWALENLHYDLEGAVFEADMH
ncbi:hypothetical protein O181_013476 [Austropuccinia psidii MF-1]|uniref:Reverse transcriptase RNase H-like domain-containing protein n=1 Tax=Austropuccinia psidii MF-1 TaxID=1389203 RepID=A0A9Q3BWG7_9BASI|nr:hypothetical protein [Austropuccinia psidii MF-1]